MNFSVASVDVDWTYAIVALVLAGVYVAAAVAVGRRFGARALWAVWIAGMVVGTLFPFVVHREAIAHFEHASLIHHTAILAVPMGISAWAIARTLRRPRPAGVPVQLALGALAFILSFVVMLVAVFVLIATH